MKDQRWRGLIIFGGIVAFLLLLCISCTMAYTIYLSRNLPLDIKQIVAAGKPAGTIGEVGVTGNIKSFDYNPDSDSIVYVYHKEGVGDDSTSAQIYMYDESEPQSRRLIADNVGTDLGYYVGFGSEKGINEHIYYFDSNIPGLVELRDGQRKVYLKTVCSRHFINGATGSVGMVLNMAEDYTLSSYSERYYINSNEVVVASDCDKSSTKELKLPHLSERNRNATFSIGTEKIMSVPKADFEFSQPRGAFGATNSTSCSSVKEHIQWGGYFYEISSCDGNIRFAESWHLFNKDGVLFLDHNGIYLATAKQQ